MACACLISAPCFGHTTFLAVDCTPYDRQMAPVSAVLNVDAGPRPSQTTLFVLNKWMFRLRAMPYRYFKQWKTPAEVLSDRMGDCKGKAVALYEKLLASGAHHVRIVIGKHRVDDSRTHAWVEWETLQGTLLLDPTFNWTATKAESQDKSTYIPFYAFDSGHKYRAFDPTLLEPHYSFTDPVASRE